MPHYDLKTAREIPFDRSQEERIAARRNFADGFTSALRFAELFGHPFKLPQGSGYTTLASLRAKTLREGKATGVGDVRFKQATFGSIITFASDYPERNSIPDLSLHKGTDVNHLLAVTYDPRYQIVHVDDGEGIDLPATTTAIEETSRAIAEKATEFFASIDGVIIPTHS